MEEDNILKETGLSFADFFDLFIALNYIHGTKKIDLSMFKKFLKTHNCKASNLNSIIKSLEEKAVATIDKEYKDILIINESMPVMPLIGNKGRYVDQVLKVVNSFDNFRAQEIGRMYDMMIDKEAIDAYHQDTCNKMAEEFYAHAKAGLL